MHSMRRKVSYLMAYYKELSQLISEEQKLSIQQSEVFKKLEEKVLSKVKQLASIGRSVEAKCNGCHPVNPGYIFSQSFEWIHLHDVHFDDFIPNNYISVTGKYGTDGEKLTLLIPFDVFNKSDRDFAKMVRKGFYESKNEIQIQALKRVSDELQNLYRMRDSLDQEISILQRLVAS